VQPGLEESEPVGQVKLPIGVDAEDVSQLPPDELVLFQAQRILSTVEEPG